MFDPKALEVLIAELPKLNANLERLHEDAAELRKLNQNLEEARGLYLKIASNLKEVNGKFKLVGALAKQVYIFNQILMQISKVQGAGAVLSKLFEGLVEFAKRGA